MGMKLWESSNAGKTNNDDSLAMQILLKDYYTRSSGILDQIISTNKFATIRQNAEE